MSLLQVQQAMMAKPPTPPTFVQFTPSAANALSTTCTSTAAPVAGHLLLAFVTTMTGKTVTMPAGWSLVTSKTGGQVILWVYAKISDGSETSVLVTQSATGYMSAETVEFADASLVIPTPASGSTASALSPLSFGPSGAPPNSNCRPVCAMAFRGRASPGTFSISSPWFFGTTAGTFANTGAAYEASITTVAVSGTLSYTNVSEDGFDFLWIIMWLQPA